MVCTASRPGDGEFDVRCYHESFMPVVRRMRALYSQGVKHDEVYRTIDAEVKAKKLAIPDHPIAGYCMLGPISAYRPATNTVDKDIESWQSVHFPYKTAAEIGLPEEGQVSRTLEESLPLKPFKIAVKGSGLSFSGSSNPSDEEVDLAATQPSSAAPSPWPISPVETLRSSCELLLT